MKIIAKQGSELEKLLKEMNDQLLREQEEAKDMVQEYCGTRPDAIGYGWVFGITAEWNCNLIGFNDKSFVPEKLIPNNEYKDNPLWKPNKRKKDAKEFINRWREKFRGIDGEPLSKFGIPVMDEKTGIYCSWLPLQSEKGYYVSVGSSLLERMPSAKSEQFEIDV